MIKPFTCVCMLLAAGSGLYVYQTKHRGQMLDKEIARVLKATEAVRQRTIILRSEWAVLNEPDHLAELARTHLALRTTATSQLAALSDLGSRLPAPLPPGSTVAPADETEVTPALPPLPAPGPVAADRSGPARLAATRPNAPPSTPAPGPMQLAALLAPPARMVPAPGKAMPAPGKAIPAAGKTVPAPVQSLPAATPATPPVQVAALPAPPASHPAPKPAARTADHPLPDAAPRTANAPAPLPPGATPVAAPPAPVRPHITAPVVSVAAAAIPAPVRPAQAVATPASQPTPGATSVPGVLGASALGGARTALPAPVPYAQQPPR